MGPPRPGPCWLEAGAAGIVQHPGPVVSGLSGGQRIPGSAGTRGDFAVALPFGDRAARLLANGLEDAGESSACIRVVSPLEEAMRVAVEEAGLQDLVDFNSNGRQAELTLRQLRVVNS